MTAASGEPVESSVSGTGTGDPVPETPAEAEWPPREWREGQRGGGNASVYRVVGLIALIMIALVVLSFWGVGNG